MYQNCKNAIQRCLRDAVDIHGGAFVETRKGVEDLLREECPDVPERLISHFGLTFQTSRLIIRPYKCENGTAVIIFDGDKYSLESAIEHAQMMGIPEEVKCWRKLAKIASEEDALAAISA